MRIGAESVSARGRGGADVEVLTGVEEARVSSAVAVAVAAAAAMAERERRQGRKRSIYYLFPENLLFVS